MHLRAPSTIVTHGGTRLDPALIDLHAEVSTRHWWFVARSRIVQSIAGELLDGTATAVDLGCGVGANAAALSEIMTCVGFDASERAIGHARRLHPGTRFEHTDVFEVPAEVGSADLVLLMDVLEHVEDDHGLLQRVVTATRPGTYVLLTVPAHPELWSDHDVASGHVRRYTLDTFASLWEDLPVEQVLLSHFNSRLFQPARLVRMFRRRFRSEAEGEAARSDLDRVPRPLDAILARIFTGERRRLRRAMRGRGRPYRSGLSLIALLRRGDA